MSGRLSLAAAVAMLAAAALPGWAPEAKAQQCAAGTLHFHPEGGLSSCRIEAYHRMRTEGGYWVTCRPGEVMRQHENGALASCAIDEVQTFGDVRCAAGTHVFFTDRGDFERCD